MAKKKTKTKFLNSRIKFDKTLVMVTMAVLTVVAGYLIYKGTRATSQIAPKMPVAFRGVIIFTNIKTSDDIKNTQAWCFNNYWGTGVGPVTYCGNVKGTGSAARWRFGLYNTYARTFFKTSGSTWLTPKQPFYGIDKAEGSITPFHYIAACPGIHSTAKIYGIGPFSTDFGPVHFGEIMRYNYALGKWQQEQGTYTPLDGKCHGGNDWHNIQGLLTDIQA